MDIKLKCGRGEVAFRVPEERLKGIAEAKASPSLSDPLGALREAMANPLGPRLSEVVGRGDKILLLTVDFTRPSPRDLMSPVVEAIREAGASVDVMIGLGNHQAMTDDELIEHLGTADVMQSDPPGPVWEIGVTTFGTPIEVDRRQ